MARALVGIVVCWALCGEGLALAEEVTVASCDLVAVQAAVDAASDGDTVRVPEGQCTWSDSLGWENKNIAVVGAGIDKTVITTQAGGVSIKATTQPAFRLSGFTFTGTPAGRPQILNVSSSGSAVPVKGWRIDHVRLSYPEENGITGMYVTGLSWGLVDNSVFDGTGYVTIESASYTEADGWPPGPKGTGASAWEQPLGLGTEDALYVEDCLFDFTSDSISAINDQVYGARQVFRHNTIRHAFFQTHATRGSDRGGMKYEIYSNTFEGSGFIWPALLRSGTGVIFDNHVSGYQNNDFVIDNQRTCIEFEAPFSRCDGSRPVDGNVAGEFGWPCLDQIGRGPGAFGAQASEPLHAWDNVGAQLAVNGDFDLCTSSQPKLATHIKSTPHSNGEVDYVNGTPRPGYAPFVYPHPLRGEEPIGGGGPSGSGGGGGGGGVAGVGGGGQGNTGGAVGGGDAEAGDGTSGCSCHLAGQSRSVGEFAWLALAIAIGRKRFLQRRT